MKHYDLKACCKNISAVLCLVVMISFAMIGCGRTALKTDTDYIAYLSQNPVVTEAVELENFLENAPQSYLYNTIKVSGLKKDNVQKSVNDTINTAFNSMMGAEPPAYRGILAGMDSQRRIESEIISTNVMGNFNNILSVLMTRTVKQGGISYMQCETLNFDLNTGEQIRLKDLFEAEDGGDTLNKEIASQLNVFENLYNGNTGYDSTSDYLMLTMFKGINEDQKFYLSDGEIHIILDYENQEFYQPHYSPYEVVVNFNSLNDALVINKYMGGSNEELYSKSGEASYLLVYGNEDVTEKPVSVPEGSSNVHFGASCTYPAGMPDKAVERAVEWSAFDTQTGKTLLAEAAANPGYQYGLTNIVRGTRVGNYYNVMKSVSYYNANHWEESVESVVYDLKGNEVSLEALFKKGADYETVIKEALKEKLSYDFEGENYGGSTIEEIYEGVSFNLDSYGIQIKTGLISFTGTAGSRDYDASVSLFIPYNSFGCENMTIF